MLIQLFQDMQRLHIVECLIDKRNRALGKVSGRRLHEGIKFGIATLVALVQACNVVSVPNVGRLRVISNLDIAWNESYRRGSSWMSRFLRSASHPICSTPYISVKP